MGVGKPKNTEFLGQTQIKRDLLKHQPPVTFESITLPNLLLKWFGSSKGNCKFKGGRRAPRSPLGCKTCFVPYTNLKSKHDLPQRKKRACSKNEGFKIEGNLGVSSCGRRWLNGLSSCPPIKMPFWVSNTFLWGNPKSPWFFQYYNGPIPRMIWVPLKSDSY